MSWVCQHVTVTQSRDQLASELKHRPIEIRLFNTYNVNVHTEIQYMHKQFSNYYDLMNIGPINELNKKQKR